MESKPATAADTDGRAERSASASTTAGQPKPPDDPAITAAVTRQLMKDPGIDEAQLTVRTRAGIVELTGSVEDLLSKERAVRLAENIRGVRTVSDRIDLKVKQRADKDIQRDVETALKYNATTDAMEISPKAAGGVVTLNGKVQSWVEKELAERIAKSVTGVRAVDNELSIDYLAERSDSEIQKDIESRLRWDALVDGDLTVVVTDGKVRLSGRVGSAAERTRAYSDARVVGVLSMDTSGIDVVPQATGVKPRASAYVVKPDAELARAIEAAALYDPRVNSFQIHPDVTLGVVTLRGEVDNLQAKLAAESLARHTVGVMDVKNEIRVVPGSTLTDAQKAQRIEAALSINPLTETYDMNVQVERGQATLTGRVNTVFESAAAADVASTIQGITSVDNDLVVATPGEAYIFTAYLDPYAPYVETRNYLPPTASQPDGEIMKDIQDEMFWSPYVDSEEVKVHVTDGKATLTGTVDSWAERTAATENALEGGAIAVYNQLKVE